MQNGTEESVFAYSIFISFPPVLSNFNEYDNHF